jgi:hypothetical protein
VQYQQTKQIISLPMHSSLAYKARNNKYMPELEAVMTPKFVFLKLARHKREQLSKDGPAGLSSLEKKWCQLSDQS